MSENKMEILRVRINELYHKSKDIGLTDAEKKEQQELRAEYVAEFRKSFRAGMDNYDVLQPDGSVVNLGELRKSRIKN